MLFFKWRLLNCYLLWQVKCFTISCYNSSSGTLASDEDVADASFDDIEFYSVALDSATIASKYNAVKDSHPNIKLTSSKSTIYAGGDTANTSNFFASSLSFRVNRKDRWFRWSPFYIACFNSWAFNLKCWRFLYFNWRSLLREFKWRLLNCYFTTIGLLAKPAIYCL